MKKDDKKWMKEAVKPENKGKLREKLGAKEGKPIPEKKLEKAEHSKDPLMRKRANLAEILKGFKH